MKSKDVLALYLEAPTSQRFRSVVEELRDHVYVLAARVLKDDALAEDVTQDVFLLLCDASRWQDHKIRSGLGFVTSLTLSVARTKKRSEARRHYEILAPDVVENASSPIGLSPLDLAVIYEAIESLPPAHRECVERRYLEGQSIDSIAEAIDRNRRTVLYRIAAGTKTLRQKLSPARFALIAAVLHPLYEKMKVSAAEVPKALAARLDQIARSWSDATPAPDSVPLRNRPRERLPAGASVQAAKLFLVSALLASLIFTAVWRMVERDLKQRAGVAGAPEPTAVESQAASEPVAQVTPAVAHSVEAPPVPRPAAAAEPEAESGETAAVEENKPPNVLASVELHVVDEEDVPVRHGTVTLYGPGMVPGPDQGLVRGDEIALRLDTYNLAERNPRRLRFLSERFIGVDLTARVYADEYPRLSRARFRAELGENRKVEIVLRSRLRAQIALKDAVTGESIARAAVMAKTRIEEKNTYQRIRSVSNAEGFCTFRGLRAGAYDLDVAAYGYESTSLRSVDLEGLNTVWLQPSAPPSGEVTVRVYDPESKLQEGVEVTCRFAGDAISETTNAEGVCVFTHLPAAECRFEIERPKGAGNPFVHHVTATLGEGEALNVVLGKAPTAVVPTRFVDPAGKPVVRLVQFAGSAFLRGKTREDGVLMFRHAPGDYVVSILGPTVWELFERLSITATSMPEVQFVVGLKSLSGEIAGASIYNVSKVRLEGADRSGETRVSEDGRFTFEGLVPGRYELVLPELEYPLAPPIELEIDGGEEDALGEGGVDDEVVDDKARVASELARATQSISIDLERRGVLRLSVADAEGRPLPEAEVECQSRGRDGARLYLPPHASGERWSVFAATIESGKYRVVVRSRGHVVWRGSAEVAAGETTHVEVDVGE